MPIIERKEVLADGSEKVTSISVNSQADLSKFMAGENKVNGNGLFVDLVPVELVDYSKLEAETTWPKWMLEMISMWGESPRNNPVTYVPRQFIDRFRSELHSIMLNS